VSRSGPSARAASRRAAPGFEGLRCRRSSPARPRRAPFRGIESTARTGRPTAAAAGRSPADRGGAAEAARLSSVDSGRRRLARSPIAPHRPRSWICRGKPAAMSASWGDHHDCGAVGVELVEELDDVCSRWPCRGFRWARSARSKPGSPTIARATADAPGVLHRTARVADGRGVERARLDQALLAPAGGDRLRDRPV